MNVMLSPVFENISFILFYMFLIYCEINEIEKLVFRVGAGKFAR